MRKLLKKSIFYGILVIVPIFIWLGLECIANKITHRFDPLIADKEKNSLHLNQEYFNDFFLYELPVFNTTSASNRAIHMQKENRFRILCLGESTTAGYPYNTFPHYNCPSSFANYLRAILQYNREVPELEILNAGCNALNSQNVCQIFKDLIPYHPDLVIVYTGHNEFFGANEFVVPKEKLWLYENPLMYNAYMALRRTYLYIGLRRLLHFLPKSLSGQHQDYLEWSKKNSIPPSDPLNEIVRKNYRRNLTEIMHLAKDAGIKVVLCTPVSNWIFPPFISKHDHGLTQTEQVQWDSLSAQATSCLNKNDYDAALQKWNALKKIDSTYAELYFQCGKAYAKLNQYQYAGYELWRAKDYDALPFRARSFVSVICRDVAQQQGAALADLEQFFIRLSDRSYPDPNLLVDHLHPNDPGNYYTALESSDFR
jgi:lysophospholipase L1-like esterase